MPCASASPAAAPTTPRGVSVEVGERQAAVDITLIAEYGVPIADLASAVRRNVIASVERMTGLEVTEVNLEVSDVHLPEDDDEDAEQTPPGSSDEPRPRRHRSGNSRAQVTVEQLADDLADVVRAVPGVSDLHPGALGEIGTYLPGRRVAGIRLRDEALSGARVPRNRTATRSRCTRGPGGGAPIRETAHAVHAAVAQRLATAGLHPAVLVNVADIAADLTVPAS